MYKILIVEDDLTIAGVLEKHLTKWGYEARQVADLGNVLSEFLAYLPQLVLLDISLPYYNGYHWCAEIRKCSRVPIIFISSASDNMNVIMAMNMGGDDFLAKPFDLDVAVAKIQALLRRTYAFGGPADILAHGDVILNLGDATLSVGEHKLELTKNEFKIMQILLEHKGRTVSRDALMKRLWESESFIDDNTLTVNVTRLRKKLEDCGLTGFIRTKKGLGYLILDE